jgi:catechol 2,3-dioxygenase-like lactoylglutathione lyase family enzyme
MLERFSHMMLFVADLDRAVIWYGEKLGFVPNFVVPGAYASLRHEQLGLRLDLHPTETAGKDVGFGPMPYFGVKDIGAALKTLSEKGVKIGPIQQEGMSPRFATFWDSEGNALGLEELGLEELRN